MYKLDDRLAGNVLGYLGCPPQPPTLRYLNRLIRSYIRAIPWESVSRIIKRHVTPGTQDCPRLPVEFWKDALQQGFGGTCYESSLAFYSLLVSLGYEGYLTVNDMGSTRGCHAAIVLQLHEQKYLVDITIPVHAAVRIDPDRVIRRHTPLYNYSIHPAGKNTYAVTRSCHPKRNAFTLIDIPVELRDYRTILERDYLKTGYFLDRVVMNKVVGCKTARFFSDLQPYRLERFDRHGKQESFLEAGTLPCELAEVFNLPQEKIAAALVLVSPAGA